VNREKQQRAFCRRRQKRQDCFACPFSSAGFVMSRMSRAYAAMSNGAALKPFEF
jgi:hypothetical protein